MTSKLKAITTALCIAVIFGAGFYIVDWSQARQSKPDRASDSEASKYRERTVIKADPNGFLPMDVVERRKPITKVDIISRKQADDWLEDPELVIGVVVGGKPRAYVINTMTGPSREIFNDVLAGKAIAATW